MYSISTTAALPLPVRRTRMRLTLIVSFRIAKLVLSAGRIGFALFSLFILQAVSVAAEMPLSLDDALKIAIQESLQLSAQRSAVTAAEQATVSARELPDPKLKLGIDNLPLEGPDRYSVARDFMTARKIGIAQDFPLAQKRELKGQRAEQQLAREQSALGDTRATLRRDVALTWIERYFAERTAAVIDEQYAETELQLQALRSGLRANKTQPAEVLALQVNLQSLLDRRAEFEKQAARAKAMLSRWLGEASLRPLAMLPEKLVADRQHESLTHAAWHPHLQTLERQIDVAQSDAALAKVATKPDWGLEVAYSQRGSSYFNMLSVQLSIDLPLFQDRRQNRELAAKLAQVEQARAVKEDAQRLHLAESAAAWVDWEAATARIERYDNTLLPLTRERLKQALAAYRGGQGPLAPVLEARRAELELKLQKLQLAADQGRAYAQLLYFLPEENVK